MRLIVGLGNPGPEYEWTPHNMGFLAIDLLSQRVLEKPDDTFYEKTLGGYVARMTAKPKPAHWQRSPRAIVERGFLKGQEVVLAKPSTFMNDSGRAVHHLMIQFHVPPSSLVVVSDDYALPWGHIRIRRRGSAGGHNGLKSIIGCLNTNEFPRVRIGVNPQTVTGDLSDYVLKPIRKSLRPFAEQMALVAADSLESIVQHGEEWTMGTYNNKTFTQN